ncbi:MAG: hypothetical protein IMX00_06265 [Limnochordales bacterium]|nr:hypothetical protein [Limnochordales bacterium]
MVRSLRIFGRTWQLAYTYLGMTLAISAIWFFSVVGPLLVAYVVWRLTGLLPVWPLALLASIATTGASTPAVFALTYRLTKNDQVELVDYLKETRTFWKPGVVLAFIDVLITLILILDIWVVWNAANPTIRFFTWVWLYLAVFWLMILPLHYPLLVRQTSGGVGTVLRNSVLITLGNPALSFLVLLGGALIVLVNTLLSAGLLLLLAGLLGFHYNLYLSEVILVARQRRSFSNRGEAEQEAGDGADNRPDKLRDGPRD